MTNQSDEPVHILEDGQTGDRFLIFNTAKGLRMDLRYEGETLWMTQAQIAKLFAVNVPSISRHISNIIAEGELDPGATVSKIETVRSEGTRQVARTIEHYSLDMIISVGYRVSSKQATLFRRWATGILVQFAKKGFVVDTIRLKDPDNAGRRSEKAAA